MKRLALATVVLMSLAEAGRPSPALVGAPAPQNAAPARRPNIVFVLTDDLASNLVPYMPHVVAMQKAGVTFANYFVTDSLCCPSRSSIFTGRYPHDTGVFTNRPPLGGYEAFNAHGNDCLLYTSPSP